MARAVVVNIVGDTSRLESALRRADGRLASFGAQAKKHRDVIAGALAGGAAVRGVGAIVKAYGDYDTALRQVGAVSGTSGKQLDQLGDIARSAGLRTGVGATAAADAMAELAKAGLNTSQIGPALKGTLALAQAGSISTADAASAAANAMQTFGLRAQDTSKIADTFANAANATTADVGDFALALSQGGAAAKIAGLSFSDTSLVLTELARIGIKGSDAGTSLKTAFLQLASPTDKAKAAMEKYNLSFFDHNGKVRDAADISDMLRSKLGKLSNQQQIQVLKSIAGTDGFRTLAAMMKVSGAQADQLASQLAKPGSAAETAAKKQAGFQGSMNRLKASAQELAITLGDEFAPDIAKAADQLSKLSQDPGFRKNVVSDVHALVDTVKSFAVAAKPAAEFAGEIGSALNSLPTPIKSSIIQLGILAGLAKKMSGLGRSVGLVRGELDKVPASAAKANAAIGVGGTGAAAGMASPRLSRSGLGAKNLYNISRAGGYGRFASAAVAAPSLASTLGGRLPGAFNIAALGSLGAQFAGSTIGGKTGKAVSRIGTGAAIGAGIGSFAGPIGTGVGALAGGATSAIVGAFKSADRKRAAQAAAAFASQTAKGATTAVKAGFDRRSAQGLGRSQAQLAAGRELQDAARKRPVGPGGGLAVADPARLQRAVTNAKAAGLDPKAVLGNYSNAYRKAGQDSLHFFEQGLRTGKATNAANLLQKFTAGLKNAQPQFRQQGALAMLEYARSLEKNGQAPRGTVARLSRQLSRQFGIIIPSADAAGRGATAAIDRALNDRKLVSSANRLRNDLAKSFDLPPLTAKSIPGALATTKSSISELQRTVKDKNAPQTLKDQANAALPSLRKQYDQTLDRISKRYGISREDAAKWATSVDRAARKAGGGATDVDTLSRAVDAMNGRLTTGDIAARRLSRSLQQLGLDSKTSKLLSTLPSRSLDALGITGNRRGGKIRRFQDGGMVPALVSSGEALRYPDGGWGMVPGAPVAADNVSTFLPVGTEVFTHSGQDMLAGGASRAEALAAQMPHFAKGGKVVRGRTSTFGPPGEAAGRTASGLSSSAAGIALNINPGTDSGWNNASTNKWVQARQMFTVSVKGHTANLPVIDKGPAGFTKRAIDITGAGARKLGINPANFPTDAIGTATLGAGKSASSGKGSSPASGGGSSKSTTTITDNVHAVSAATAARNMPLYRQPIVDVSGVFDQARSGTYDAAARATLLNEIIDATKVEVTKNTTTSSSDSAGGSTGAGAAKNYRGLVYPFASRRKLIGRPGQGTHNGKPPFDNWQSRNAVDISAPIGTPLRAVGAGTISRVSGAWHGGAGRTDGLTAYLSTGAGGKEWFYQHMSARSVKAGQKVRAGQTIGKSGAGNGVPHLHLASESGNPVSLLAKAVTSIPRARRSSGSSGAAGARSLSGVGTFQGRPVAKWIIPELKYAQAHGWRGQITSGYRSPPQVVDSPVKAPQGKSEHQGTRYPHGAIDFGAPYSVAAARARGAFLRAARGYTGPKLVLPKGFRDDGHLSGTGHRRGGRVARFASGGTVGQVSYTPSLGTFGGSSKKPTYAPPKRATTARVTDIARATTKAIGSQGREALQALFGAGVRDNKDVTEALAALSGVLSNARRATSGRLNELAHQLDIGIRRTFAKNSPKGAGLSRAEVAQNKRAQAAIAIVQAELLARSGKQQDVADRFAAKNTQAQTNFNLRERVLGIDSSSARGITDQLAEYDRQLSGNGPLAKQRAALVKAQGLAKKAGKSGQEAYKQLTQEIQDLDNTVADTAASRVEAARNLPFQQIAERLSHFDLLDARAALTADTGDDRSALLGRQAELQQDIATAQAAGREDLETQYLQALKSVNDSLSSLDTTMQEQKDSADALTDLLKQNVDNQNRIISGQGLEKDVLARSLAGLVSGSIGGGLSRGVGTPGFPGQLAIR